MKVVFLGTPDFAVNALNALINSSHEVIAIVTQPDKEVGRGRKIRFSPVKEVAIKNGIKVLQYKSIRKEGVAELKTLNADIFVTAAYGQILSQAIIDIPKNGILNIHGSLLPLYRGASPIQQAIIDGRKESGVTIMQTERGIDTGDILLVKKTPIEKNETAGELFDKISELGAKAIVEALDLIENGKAKFVKQDHLKATHCKMFTKADGFINWEDTAINIHNKVRGFNPWPSAFTYINGKTLKIWQSKVVEGLDITEDNYKAGQIVKANKKDGLIVKCGKGYLQILVLQNEGSKRLNIKDYLNGNALEEKQILG